MRAIATQPVNIGNVAFNPDSTIINLNKLRNIIIWSSLQILKDDTGEDKKVFFCKSLKGLCSDCYIRQNFFICPLLS